MKHILVTTETILLLFVVLFFANTKNAQAQQMPDENFCAVEANLIFGDSVCMVNATAPLEYNYDDGTHEDIISWATPGGQTAVRFTPQGYPMLLTGGKINVGDGTFPSGADFLGTDFRMIVYGDDGQDKLPGTPLDSITVVADRYEWVKFGGLNVEIDSGDFYLAMKQLHEPQYAAPVGIDNQPPIVNRSYVKQPGNENWMVSPYQDIMIRSLTCGLTYDKRELKPNITNNTWYQVARVSDFDPTTGQTPEDGVLTILDSLSFPTYKDSAFYQLPVGYYAYAMRILSDSNGTTNWYYTNVLQRNPLSVKNQVDLFHSITVYPNPAKDKFTVRSKEVIKTVSIVTMEGQTVFYKAINKSTFSVSTGFLREGLYFVRFTTGRYVISTKLLIRR